MSRIGLNLLTIFTAIKIAGNILLTNTLIFLKMGRSRPQFVYFRSFHIPIQMTNIHLNYKNLKSVYDVLGTQTWGGRMEGAHESTELMLHPAWRNFIKTFQ